MPKSKKPTNQELINYFMMTENKLGRAIDVLGKSLTDYIEWRGDKEDFIIHLQDKYKEVRDEMSKMPKGAKAK